MALPAFNEAGDFPPGLHRASLDEVVARLGRGSQQREAVTQRLKRVHQLARATGQLDRLVIFGSYVSDETSPNDVDVILVMRDNFRVEDCPAESAVLFDHERADALLGASVFWIRPEMLLTEGIEQFLSFWQTRRDGKRRGLVEVTA